MEHSLRTDNKPWYRHFWPWVLIGIPFASVAGSMLMIHLATSGHDGVVREYYRKDGRGILEDSSRDQHAADLALAAELAIDEETGDVRLSLATGGLAAPPASLQLLLVHPTRARGDQNLTLIHLRDGHYAGRLDHRVEGRRELHLLPADRSWRIKLERAYFPLRQSLSLTASHGR